MNHKQENFTSLSKLKQCTNAFNSQFSKIKIIAFRLKRFYNEFKYVSCDNLIMSYFCKYLKFVCLELLYSQFHPRE